MNSHFSNKLENIDFSQSDKTSTSSSDLSYEL